MRSIIAIFVLTFFSCLVEAQDLGNQIKSLQLNTSPAYVILGVEPENIQRPNSPTDFIASVQSAMVNERLQPNFAMETTPYYWGKKKPDSKQFNALDYLFSNNYGENLLKSFTLSFATSASDTVVFGKLQAGTALGLGFHLQLLQGRVSKNTRTYLADWYTKNHMRGVVESIINKIEGDDLEPLEDLDFFLDETLAKGNNKTIPEGEKNLIKYLLKRAIRKTELKKSDLSVLRNLRDKLENISSQSIDKVNQVKLPLTREGFMLEFAFANASVAEESKWNKLSGVKTSIWITPSYRFNVNKDPEVTDFIDLMAVARLTFNSKEVDSSNYVDVGGKLQWIHNRLSLSGEAIYRHLTQKPDSVLRNHTFRTAFTLSYKLNELVTFKATFGSNFDGNSTKYSDPSKMFAVGGFNFGFSNFFRNAKD